MNWDSLQKPGRNGLLLVMMALVWWGKASANCRGWKTAVIDISTVVCCMIDSSEPSPSLKGSSEVNKVTQTRTQTK